ncbi:MAG TPA: hypothetical protein PKZ76_05790 [Xanthomonadaceae bacterium]|nr:hypothetical protein [Xanthomonadaceae bacterium]
MFTASFQRTWRTSASTKGAEIDLVLRRGDALFGVECKRADAPRMTPSLRIAREDLGLKGIAILYPGTRRFTLSETVQAVPLAEFAAHGRLFG